MSLNAFTNTFAGDPLERWSERRKDAARAFGSAS